MKEFPLHSVWQVSHRPPVTDDWACRWFTIGGGVRLG